MKTPLNETELAILYGRKPVEEVLRHNPQAITEVFVVDTLAREIQSQADRASIRCRVVSRDELDKLCKHTQHQGVVAKLAEQQVFELEDAIERVFLEDSAGVLLVLDQISDPQNVGALLRAAEAAGVGAVLMTTDRSAPLTQVVRKASAGASELVPICRIKNLQRALRQLKEAGVWIIGTSLGDGALSLYETEFPKPIAVVFGSEGQGMRELTKKECDLLVQIPMRGKLQSLNVSQAASVVLFEILRRGL